MSPETSFWTRLFGDPIDRADRLLRDGKLIRASQEYARAGQFGEAARISVRAGDIKSALESLDRGGLHFEAAVLLESEGRPGEAVEAFLLAEMPLRAALAAEAARQPLRAAVIFEQAGHDREAAELFEQAGDFEAVLRTLDRESEALGDRSTREDRLDSGARRARAMARIGRVREAAELLRALDHPGAAELFARAGSEEEAVDAFLELGGVVQAQRIAEDQEIDPEMRSNVLERVAASAGQIPSEWAERADQLEQAGELRSASELLLDHGLPGRAARLLERVGDVESAAAAYSRAGEMDSAARCYELAGRPKRSAGCLLLANEPVLAAAAFLEAQDVRSALAAIGSIDEVDPRYEAATLLLAPALYQAGEWDDLLDRLGRIPKLGATKRTVLERNYWRACCLHSVGRDPEAERSFQAVVEIDGRFRDAKKQLKRLRKKGAKGSETLLLPARERTETGEILAGRYEILEKIGQGGMSVIHRARDLEAERIVAVKTLMVSSVADPSAEERLLREAQICQRIRHEGVVEVFDFGRFDGGIYVAMELLQGLTLETLIREKKLFATAEAISILRDVLVALDAIHAESIIHRDIKPANLAVTPARVKIMDFGIALAPGTDVALTRPGQVMGSPMYMSPEQIQGFELDQRTDLYSFGVVCFTLLAGREPFPGKTPADVVLKHLQEQPPDLYALRPDVPEGLTEIIAELLAKEPKDRPSTARDVLNKFEQFA